MCLNKIKKKSRTFRVGKHLSVRFPIKGGLKKGDTLSPWLFKSALENVIRRVQANKESLKLNDTLQLLVYANDANKLGGSIYMYTIRKNTETLIIANKEIGLEENAVKMKYMLISREQNEGNIATYR
jgi:hypothetical protein